jgi:LCP family protein required for cell wall assembly
MLVSAFGLIAILMVAVAIVFGYWPRPVPNKSITSKPEPTISGNASLGQLPNTGQSGNSDNTQSTTSMSILLLGYGGAGHDGPYLTDSLIVLDIDSEKKLINLISIPRDLFVSIPYDWDNTQGYKINSAYAIGVDDRTYANKHPEFRGVSGGGNLAKYVVGKVIGLPIKYFISVDFSKFQEAIDLIGGIDVNVAVTFEDDFYPVVGRENDTCGFSSDQISQLQQKYTDFALASQYTCRYEKLRFEKGVVHMDGSTALKYVRSRHSSQSGGDFSRSARQQAVLEAIEAKVFSLNILSSANPLFGKMVGSVTTDFDSGTISRLLSYVRDAAGYKINHLYLTNQNVLMDVAGPGGAAILLPKAGRDHYDAIAQYVKGNSP